MDRILIILRKENGPRASSALGLNTIIFKHVYLYKQQTQVSVYRTIGPLVYLDRFKSFGSFILIFISSSILRLFPKNSIIEPEDKKNSGLFEVC